MSEEKKTVELKEEDLEKVSGGYVDTSNAKYTNGNLFHKNDGVWDFYIKITGFGQSERAILYKTRFTKVNISDGSIIRGSGGYYEYELDLCTPITTLPSNVTIND